MAGARDCVDHNPPGAVATLVCLPGVNSGAYLFNDAARALGQGWRVICMNVPGVDGTPLPLPFSAKSYARQAWQVLDRMGVHEPVAVLGHSMGGFAAQEMARLRPEKVQRLVLVSTSRGQPDMTADLNAMKGATGRSFWDLGREIDDDPSRAMQVLFGRHFLTTQPQVYAAFIDARQRHLPSVTARLAHLSAGGTFSSVAWVHRLTCPALVAHGTEDVLVRAASGKRLSQSLPQGRWLELFGVGHFPMLEHEQFWHYVRDFLGGAPLGVKTEKPPNVWVQRIKEFLYGRG